MIRFLIVPDMLKNAPMFKPKSGAKGLAAGAGKSAMIRAQGKYSNHLNHLITAVSLDLILSLFMHCSTLFTVNKILANLLI